ncbi:MAG: extracellular solute-binding protein, partial [Chloroflexi bacterium]|nr:extracellular solute-binding protein [Chloroflexota bacterium]
MSRQMTRRQVLRYSAVAGSAGLLAACQPAVVEKVVEKEKIVKETVVVEVAKVEPVTIQVWSRYLNPVTAEPFAVLKERWASVNPLIVIEESPMAGSQDEQRQKIAAAVAAGNPPDLWNNTSPKTWGLRGMVIPLNAFADAKGNWDPAAWYNAMIDHYTDHTTGTLYGFQQESDDRGLYWRKDLFAEAGLDPEKPPTTFSEHREIARKLTVKSGDFYERLGFHPLYGQAWIWG